MRAVFLITVRFYFYRYSDAAVTLCGKRGADSTQNVHSSEAQLWIRQKDWRGDKGQNSSKVFFVRLCQSKKKTGCFNTVGAVRFLFLFSTDALLL